MAIGLPSQTQVIELLDGEFARAGYEIEDVLIDSRARPPRITVIADGDTALDLDTIAALSHSASTLLDAVKSIAGGYVLEVSSPGIDRPLTRPKDYETWAGHEAKVESLVAVDGRKRFRGTLLGLAEDGQVRLLTEAGEVAIPPVDIKSARLVLTDALIDAVTKGPEGQG